MAKLAPRRCDVTCLLHNMFAHGVARRLRRLILHAGAPQYLIPHVVNDLCRQSSVAVGLYTFIQIS